MSTVAVQKWRLTVKQKVRLLNRLEQVVPATCEALAVDCIILDGGAVVKFVKITEVATFVDYANDVFKLYIAMQLQDSTRIGIVWNE